MLEKVNSCITDIISFWHVDFYEFGKYIDITGVETIENGDVEYIKSE